MADLTVKQKQIFDNYKKTHPKMSDADILSALVNLGQIQLSEEQKLSLFNNSTNNDSGIGLNLEHTQKSANPTNQPQETVFYSRGEKLLLQSLKTEKTCISITLLTEPN